MRYHAALTAGSLKVPESRTIADLLLRGTDEEGWRAAIRDENVLQARSVKTADRLRLLLRGRLELFDAALWTMVRDGSSLVATHACLAAAIKHSPLLGDFLDLTVREQHKIFSPALSNRLWEDYVEGCHARDAEMPHWSLSTIERLRSSVFQILAQAGYLEDTRSLKLQAVYIAREVLDYLHSRNESYVLRCI